MSDQLFADAVAVVTGAGRGIGRAAALKLASRGAAAVVASRNGDELEQLAHDIEVAGGRALPVRCDVAAASDVERLARATQKAFGPATVLVNSAGAYRARPFLDAELDDFRSVMEVNYFGTVHTLKALLPGMVEGGYGRVVNVASTAGKYGTANQSMYNASKHAVVGLTRCLGLELARVGVRVNAVCPGFVDTPMLSDAVPAIAAAKGTSEEDALAATLHSVPIGRLLTADEVAELVVYLASPFADAITGQAYTIAGGLLLI